MDSERLERMLAEAMQTKRPVLVNPTEDQLRQTAEELRAAGNLTCTACRMPITDEVYTTRRIAIGKGLEAVAHLHRTCLDAFLSDRPSEPQH